MTDSSRYVPSDPSPKINQHIQNNLKGFSLCVRSIPRKPSLSMNKTTIEVQDTGIHSLQLIESTEEMDEKVKSLSYLDIQLSCKPAIIMVHKFLSEYDSRSSTSIPIAYKDKIFKLSYSTESKRQCELKFCNDRIMVKGAFKNYPIFYEHIKGIIAGGMSSTVKRYFQKSKSLSKAYFFSLVLDYRTYDFAMFNYQKYILFMQIINANLKRNNIFSELSRRHLSFYIVKYKLLEEANKRDLRVSQWIILGFITYTREIGDGYREKLLLNILKDSLGCFNRFFAFITHLNRIRRVPLNTTSKEKEDSDWNHIAQINIKRYYRLKNLLGIEVDDTAIEEIINMQNKKKRKYTFKHYSPDIDRLFRN